MRAERPRSSTAPSRGTKNIHGLIGSTLHDEGSTVKGSSKGLAALMMVSLNEGQELLFGVARIARAGGKTTLDALARNCPSRQAAEGL